MNHHHVFHQQRLFQYLCVGNTIDRLFNVLHKAKRPLFMNRVHADEMLRISKRLSGHAPALVLHFLETSIGSTLRELPVEEAL
mmetsp:Transcript_14520/g.29412  ORF Transcript_14520/g.29412 Transcript_14520/m.29412 type:complete len:83 (+) Transcript_14520:1559-1807(+)|eukprot:scaffold3233_cov178-Amphora_coffeaeformis.AAC.2